MAIYTSKFTQQEIDDGIDNANSAVQPEALADYLPLSGGTMTGDIMKKNGSTLMGVFAYSIHRGKGVRITFDSVYSAIIMMKHSTSTNPRLLLFGNGRANAASFWTCMQKSTMDWCTDSNGNLELMNNSAGSDFIIRVFCLSPATPTFTEINALSNAAETDFVAMTSGLNAYAPYAKVKSFSTNQSNQDPGSDLADYQAVHYIYSNTNSSNARTVSFTSAYTLPNGSAATLSVPANTEKHVIIKANSDATAYVVYPIN